MFCRSQFGYLDQMQKEIDASSPPAPIQILGINLIGAESGNPDIVAVADLPWLQDEPSQDAWSLWNANSYDIYILNGDNVVVDSFNVLVQNLSEPANYDELKGKLLAAAAAE